MNIHNLFLRYTWGRETADEEGVGDFENYSASNLILSVAPSKLERCDLQNILDKSNSQHSGFFLKSSVNTVTKYTKCLG